jgi:adenylosuccinate lyase
MIAANVGKQTAHEIVYKASMEAVERGLTFKEVLMGNKKLAGVLTKKDIETLLDPITYVGFAASMAERVLEQTRAAGWLEPTGSEEAGG